MLKKILISIGLLILINFSSIATVYTVNSAADPGAGAGTTGSLRYCVTTANADATAGPHIINFSVAGALSLSAAFPAFTRSMIVDGRTAPGYVAGTPSFSVNRNNQTLFTANAAISISIWGINIISANGVAINFQNTFSDTIAFCKIEADNNSCIILNNAAAASGYVIQNNSVGPAGSSTGELAVLTNANNVTIINNSPLAHAAFKDVIAINGTCSNYIISNNTVTQCGNFITAPATNITSFTSSGNNVTFNSNFGYNMGTLATFTISGNTMVRNGTGGTGVSIATSSSGSITNNNITKVDNGVLFTTTASNVICSNNILSRLAGGGAYGVRVVAGASNTINNNVISFFNTTGLFLSGTLHTFNGNKITNCSIGLNLSGANNCTGITDTVTNNSSNGVYINNSNSNIFGGLGAGRCIVTNNSTDGIRIDGGNSNQIINVLSSANNGNGVHIMNSSRLNSVQSCLLGVTAAGTVASANTNNGVFLDGANVNFNTIGGPTLASGNIISGNGQVGIMLDNNGPDSTIIQYNYIGVGSDGTTVLANGVSGNAAHHAIRFNSGSGAPSLHSVIKNNVIVAPNRGCGISIQSSGNDTISYNYIGVDATGLTVVGVGSSLTTPGIYFQQDNSNQYLFGNVISCSLGGGIKAEGNCSNYTLKGNIIGMNKNGLGTTFGNNGTGIYFSNGAAKTNIVIGGTTPADRNIVSMNGKNISYSCSGTDGYGIILEKATGVTISGNYIGVDGTGNVAAGNGGSGIMLNGGCDNITVGSLTAGGGNIISSNGCNCTGPPNNARHGLQFVNNAGTIYLVLGNYVGLGADGTTLLGNCEEGVSSFNTSNIIIGGNTAAARNVIAGNVLGVFLQPAVTGCQVIGNYIGTDATGTVAKPNSIGVELGNGANNNIIGGSGAGQGNVISGNTLNGITLSFAVNNTIQQNIIGVNAFNAPLGNGADGIHIMASGTNSSQNLIGSPTNAGLGNVIAYNVSNGINIVDASNRNQIRRNSIFCNGSAGQNGINLNGVGNNNITISPLISTPPYITAPNPGINGTFTNQAPLAGTDVIEVFWDNACGTCQGRTYLGDATSLNSPTAGDWSFSPLPAASDCSPKGAAGCLVGVTNITATRTDNLGNTSQFMSCTPVFLPVELISFTAVKYSSDEVYVKWVTVSEKNNAYFEVVRSMDGKTFTPITKTPGAGNSTSINEYNFIDENLVSGIYYYMLIQVDFDGKQTMSQIITINTGAGSTIEVIPTAVASGESIKILNFTGSELSGISLVDMNGKILAENNAVGNVEFYVSTIGIAPGVYIVKINTSTGLIVKKILVY